MKYLLRQILSSTRVTGGPDSRRSLWAFAASSILMADDETAAAPSIDENNVLPPPKKKRKPIPEGPGMKKVAGLRTKLEAARLQLRGKQDVVSRLASKSVESALKKREAWPVLPR